MTGRRRIGRETAFEEAGDFESGSPYESRRTEGVETLLGDPKSAILKLSAPMVVSMLLFSLYNIVDAFWVAGLGSDALAAIGFVFPLFFVVLGIANGLGVGGGSAISRRIGAGDKTGADLVAQHTMVIMAAFSIVFTLALTISSERLFVLLGAGSAATLAADYSKVIFSGTLFILFSNVAYAILRGEGDAKRAMYAMGVASLLNILLDPILIYTLDWGIRGAAAATVLSIAVSSAVMLRWMVIKKDTFVSLHLGGFSRDGAVAREILRVAVPASFEFVSIALMGIAINLIIVAVSSTDGVAVCSVGMRVVNIGMTPLIAMSTAVISVSGAAFGARAFQKIEAAHLYSVKAGLLVALLLSGATYFFAPAIAAVFSRTEASAGLASEIVTFLHVMAFFYPAIPLGIFAAAVFQGVGRGRSALAISVLRTVVLNLLLVTLFAMVLGWGLPGVWWGMVAGNLLGDAVGYIWVRSYVGKLVKGVGF
ncbi:MATE family efflux transporter [Methanocrinis sp.]|uniref:MATE family efflux transporter n=1 Tax=Methanocrinis sp. TaxID=3101522 RepID=UPI003D0A517F